VIADEFAILDLERKFFKISVGGSPKAFTMFLGLAALLSPPAARSNSIDDASERAGESGQRLPEKAS